MNIATEHLFDAIIDCSPIKVREALMQGAEVNARSPLGLTPLHQVCYIHGCKTYRSMRRSPRTEEICQILLDAGADSTLLDSAGVHARQLGQQVSCLMPSAWHGDGEIPRCLARHQQALAAKGQWPCTEPQMPYTKIGRRELDNNWFCARAFA